MARCKQDDISENVSPTCRLNKALSFSIHYLVLDGSLEQRYNYTITISKLEVRTLSQAP